MTSWRRCPVICSAPSLQKTIFFCMSMTHTPVKRLSRMLRQASNSSKADMHSGSRCYGAHRQKCGALQGLVRPKARQVYSCHRDTGRSLFERLWHGSAIGRTLGSVLFCLVSSSGGGLPGRPGLERVLGRSLFLRDSSLLLPLDFPSTSDSITKVRS